MYNFLADLHTHEMAGSFHAYSSLSEVINKASKEGLRYVAITNHFYGHANPGFAPKEEKARFKILNQYTRDWDLPLNQIGLISGVELNFGQQERIPVLEDLGIRLIGFHDWFFNVGTFPKEQRMEIFKNAIISETSNIDIFCHPERDLQKIFDTEDEKREFLKWIVEYASQKHISLEVNEASFTTYNLDNYIHYWLGLAKDLNVQISVGSDAHVEFAVGVLDSAKKILSKLNYPEKLILNCNEEWLKTRIKHKK